MKNPQGHLIPSPNPSTRLKKVVTSGSVELPILGVPYQWNHTLHVFSVSWSYVFKVYMSCRMVSRLVRTSIQWYPMCIQTSSTQSFLSWWAVAHSMAWLAFLHEVLSSYFYHLHHDVSVYSCFSMFSLAETTTHLPCLWPLPEPL